MNWKDILKEKKLTPKQKKIDRNFNGVIDAQDFYIMNGSVKKTPEKTHYTKDGKEWKGKTHKMPDGKLMTEDPHNKKSVRLYHKEELPKRRSVFTSGD